MHIGLAPSTVSMMAKQFKIYAVKHPEIHFDIHEGSTFTLKDQLENRVVDITTLRTPISVNGYASQILMTDELCAMSVLQEKWGENGVLTLEQLSGEPLILSHRYRGFLLSAFERKGLSVDIYYECEDARTAMTLAENGLGIAILPASMRPLADKCFVYKIDSDELITEVLLAWNKEKVTDEIKEFLEFLFNQFD
ncbi:LysR family transcriptional regulator substrate-binding protein [Anaerobutyricum hallii]|uniref:LysR family transcriptional regulator substrate-binding protein n=1 Tax=Anaerobutyricum hallii TaxID=39488 RepID=UPI00266D53EB|nr:LysR family transcriptional regulator substrate-binding protein [Anaerobutyricum hallii]